MSKKLTIESLRNVIKKQAKDIEKYRVALSKIEEIIHET